MGMIRNKRARINNKKLNDLLQDLRPNCSPISQARWRSILAQKDVKVFSVREKTQIVGIAILRWHDLPVGRIGTVEDVIVAKEHRDKGYCRHLMEQIILFAKKKKMTYIDLTSRPERIAANKLYQSMGWKRRATNVYRLEL